MIFKSISFEPSQKLVVYIYLGVLGALEMHEFCGKKKATIIFFFLW